MTKFNEWWHIYENSNKGVYISDIETNEVVYLNRRIRDIFDIPFEIDYTGKTCFELFHNYDKPCSFCRLPNLEYEKTTEWVLDSPAHKHRFMVKDTKFDYNNKTYRIEFVTPIDNQNTYSDQTYRDNAEYICECIRYVKHSESPAHAIEQILCYTANTFCASSGGILLMHSYDDIPELPYYWSKNPDTAQSANHDIALHSKIWSELYDTKQGVILDISDTFLKRYPDLIKYFKDYKIQNMVLEPLLHHDKVIGFIGFINISTESLPTLTSFLVSINYWIITLLGIQNKLDEHQNLCYTDTVTGALNRHAFIMLNCTIQKEQLKSLGVISCFTTVAKDIRANHGRNAESEHICQFYLLLCTLFEKNSIYRSTGDEFIIILRNITENELEQKLSHLRETMAQNNMSIAAGCSFTCDTHFEFNSQINLALTCMYADYFHYDFNALENSYSRVALDKPSYESYPSMSYDFFKDSRHSDYQINYLFDIVLSEDVPYGIFLGDLRSNLFYLSDNMREKFGIQQTIIPYFLHIWSNRIEMPEEREAYEKNIHKLLSEQIDKIDIKYRVRDKSNQLIWVRSRASIQRDAATNKPLFYSGLLSWQEDNFSVDLTTGFARDVSALKFLTKLQGSDVCHTVIAFSPNNIRHLNESIGRRKTDNILHDISVELTNEFADNVTFFRLDGTRIIAVTRTISDEYDNQIMHRIYNIVANVYKNYKISIQIPCIISKLHYPCEIDPKEFLGMCITSLRMSKHCKKSISSSDDVDIIRQQQQRSSLALALSKSVKENFSGFNVVIQPIVSTKNEKIIKGEVLIRWKYQDTIISPNIFIPILEENNLMMPVGKWIFEQTVELCCKFIRFRPDFHLSFNVSYLQIQNHEFIDFIEQTLIRYHLSPKHLTMELTESHFNDHPETLDKFISRCHELGMLVALDDFGNGYSSFGLLMKYPADIVKLDKSILKSMSGSENHVKFIRSLIYACHEFGCDVIIEGVETEEEKDLVCIADGDMIQGYYYFKPLEVDDLYKLLLENPNL